MENPDTLFTDDGLEVRFDPLMDEFLSQRPLARLQLIDRQGLPTPLELDAESLDQLVRLLEGLSH